MKNIKETRYTSTNDFVGRNNLNKEAEEVFGIGWEAADDVNQIQQLIEHLGINTLSVRTLEYIRDDYDIEVYEVEPPRKVLQEDDFTDLAVNINDVLIGMGLVPDCTDTDDDSELQVQDAIKDTLVELFLKRYPSMVNNENKED